MKQENTIYDNENTVYDDNRSTAATGAATGNDAASAAEEKAAEAAPAQPGQKKGSAWKSASVGAGAGILLGTVASFATTTAMADDGSGAETEGVFDGNAATGGESQPAWADDEVAVATSVNDDMSFSEAFAAARAEVGAGGAFEWRGGVYGTFTADEWNNMSVEERAEYNDHFSWNNHTTTSDSSASAQESQEPQPEVEVVDDNEGEDIAENTDDNGNQDDLMADNVDSGQIVDDVEVIESDPEIEILGVTYDEETGANIGSAIIDGQEVVLIDVDGGDFDYLVADTNNDQQITDNEVFDISDQGISVEAFAEAAMTNDAMYASNDDGTTDYVNDGYDMA